LSTAEAIDDPMLARISDALGLYNSGRRAEAREAFTQLWAESNEGDRKALAAADRISRERPDAASLTVLSLYPSLYLNLGDVLHRAGKLDEARKHLKLAQQSADALADDAYGQMIRNGIERLAQRLATAG
jgi:tetratricopeptide (TPR) repeat protein